MICSMTVEERERPVIIDGNRRRRISVGSGTTVQDINKLLKQFDSMKTMMKRMNKIGSKRGQTAASRACSPIDIKEAALDNQFHHLPRRSIFCQ